MNYNEKIKELKNRVKVLKQITDKYNNKGENNMKKIKEYNCGFDLTDIGLKEFIKLLKLNDLTWTNRKKDSGAYVWGFKDGHIVTGNCPLTGNYSNPAHREPEIGYASYIGVTGTKSFRDRVVKFIKRNAKYIKGYDPKQRSYI